MRRPIWPGGKRATIVFLFIVVALSLSRCKDWEVWDQLFVRQDEGGWQLGDSAYTVALPNHRYLWLFGDTKVNNEGELVGIGCNSIAVHYSDMPENPPLRSDFRFYARDIRDLSIRNISTGDVSAATEWVSPVLGPDADRERMHWLWPGGGRVINGILYLFFSHNSGWLSDATTWQHEDTQLVRVTNPKDEATYWHMSIERLPLKDLNNIRWGAALVWNPSYGLFIFGVDKTIEKNVHLALSTQDRPYDTSTWMFLTKDPVSPWQYDDGLTQSDLKVVASQVQSELSVDDVTIDGIQRYVMVHGAFPTDDVVLRVSSSLLEWPPLGHSSGWRGDLKVFDPDLIPGTCTHPWTDCVWAVHGQRKLSNKDSMLISYFVNSYNESTGAKTGLRFMNFPLTRLKPWCSENCWNGED